MFVEKSFTHYKYVYQSRTSSILDTSVLDNILFFSSSQIRLIVTFVLLFKLSFRFLETKDEQFFKDGRVVEGEIVKYYNSIATIKIVVTLTDLWNCEV